MRPLLAFLLLPLLVAQGPRGQRQGANRSGEPAGEQAAEQAAEHPSEHPSEQQGRPNQEPARALQEEAPVSTKHEMRLKGAALHYTATAGMMPIRSDRGQIEANLFYVAYTLDGVSDVSKRPLMFAFNGGPGSASVWLHMGCIGPKRVKLNDDGSLPAAPYQLADNDQTWLDQTDLVFVDPVGTGFSRAANAELLKHFSGFQGDLESVGEFIRLYLSRNSRWTSPLFLTGESYGTLRAVSLAGRLLEQGVAFNGVVLLSTVLNFETIDFHRGNDLPYMLYLPTYTAAAFYHKKLAPDLQKNFETTLKDAEKWAESGYVQALSKGDQLTDAEYKTTAAKLARYTGLDSGYVEDSNLRVDISHFTRQLLRDRKLLAGRFDSRLTAAAPLDTSETPDFDPSLADVRAPYTAMFNQYVRTELGYHNDATYYVLGGGIERWDYGQQSQNRYVNVSESLRDALAKNPHTKVFVGSGYYDLATPYFSTEYTFSHMGLNGALRKDVTMQRYMAGHMFYIDGASRNKLRGDIGQFLKDALPVN